MTEDKSGVTFQTALMNCGREGNSFATILSQELQDDAYNLARQYCAGYDVWIGALWGSADREWFWYVKYTSQLPSYTQFSAIGFICM